MDFDDQNVEYLIVGGGVAGLSAANRLVDQGKAAVVVDAGYYPSHKVCGEFFSFECHSILDEWGVLPPSCIEYMRFHARSQAYKFILPKPARSGSRFVFDNMLYQRAVAGGAKILSQTSVSKISYSANDKYPYSVFLDDGKPVRAKMLFIGTGRILNLLTQGKPPKICYIGMKSHLCGAASPKTLEMFLLPHGYLGISPIENNQANLACLALVEAVKKEGSPKAYMDRFFPAYSEAAWMVAGVPEFRFGNKPITSFQNLYLIGDAAASIAPAAGDGLAMAVTSGVLAASFAINGQDVAYRRAARLIYRERLKWAKCLHWLLLHPRFAKVALEACSSYPKLFDFFFRKTRGVTFE